MFAVGGFLGVFFAVPGFAEGGVAGGGAAVGAFAVGHGLCLDADGVSSWRALATALVVVE